MGAARRLCVRAVVLAGVLSALLGSSLPGCQFPDYYIVSGGVASGGSAGAAAPSGGTSSTTAGAPTDAGDGGTEVAGAGGAEPIPTVPCEPQSCVPRAPDDWQGPIAFWEGTAPNAVPNCPQGYGEPIDLHRGLNAPASTCKCTCAAEGQVCDKGSLLEFFTDMGCAATPACATATLHTCDAIAGSNCGSQGSLRGASATPSGGSCEATVSAPATATWQYDARVCNASKSSVCDDPDLVCAPSPHLPYVSQLCVMRVMLEGQTPPPCPAEYPASHEALYGTFSDDRRCSDCGCSDVSGGKCTGNVSVSTSGNCRGTVAYTLGDGCVPYNLGQGNVHPTSAGVEYTLMPGTCSVASAPHALGSAAPSGNVTVVCCR
jgi:hypothetical protein